MKYILIVALTLFITQIVSQCGLPDACANQSCCECRQNPNINDGNSFLEFDESCLSGGIHCLNESGCKLCFKPVFGGVNIGDRPVCTRFSNVSETVCGGDECCLSHQNANPADGNGFMEFNPDCIDGGLNCVADTGCQLCYMPILGSVNVGNRPVCRRFIGVTIDDDACHNESCCLSMQNPNPSDGNGFMEFNSDCIDGGLNCVANSGCQLCYMPVLGSVNVGNRPTCQRFFETLVCNDSSCCSNIQNANPTDGNGYLEFNSSCLDGGLNCLVDTGCQLCFRPVLGGVNVGERPICERFQNITTECFDEECCIDHQNGLGFLEFDDSCTIDNGTGSLCSGPSGCHMCFMPAMGTTTSSDHPICKRFTGINNQVCNNDSCCISFQNPDTTDGNGYLEFNSSCLTGGSNCVASSGCQLCNLPVFGFLNVGNRPVCTRFSGIGSTICSDDECCLTHQNTGPNDGNGFLEFNSTCLVGGSNCVADSGCQLCFNPGLGGENIGNRPVCSRF